MTREMSAAAISAVNEHELTRLVFAFGFMKGCAEHLGVPHADQWQLDYLEKGIAPWRIVDRGAAAGESRRNVAITFNAASASALRLEMEVYGRAFRGMAELRDRGFALDLMADSRRQPPP